MLRNALFEKIRSEIFDPSSSPRNSEFFGIKEGFETSNRKLSKVREQKNFKITKTKLREEWRVTKFLPKKLNNILHVVIYILRWR